MVAPITDSTYIAHLWEQPALCVALFGVQVHSDEGRKLYEDSGINDEVSASLAAGADGLLLVRPMMSDEGPVLMQYWRSYDDLDRCARAQPHPRWWRWLVENSGRGLGFYHEIYQAKTAEAIYEKGTRAVGPACFCATEAVASGKGQCGPHPGGAGRAGVLERARRQRSGARMPILPPAVIRWRCWSTPSRPRSPATTAACASRSCCRPGRRSCAPSARRRAPAPAPPGSYNPPSAARSPRRTSHVPPAGLQLSGDSYPAW